VCDPAREWPSPGAWLRRSAHLHRGRRPRQVLNPILRQKGVRSLHGVPILFEDSRDRRPPRGHAPAPAVRSTGRGSCSRSSPDRIGLGSSTRGCTGRPSETSRLEGRFLATVSHELAHPLTPILRLGDRCAAASSYPPAAMQRALEAIERSARVQAPGSDDSRGTLAHHRREAAPRPPAECASPSVRRGSDRGHAAAATARHPGRDQPRPRIELIWEIRSGAAGDVEPPLQRDKFTLEGGRVDVGLSAWTAARSSSRFTARAGQSRPSSSLTSSSASAGRRFEQAAPRRPGPRLAIVRHHRRAPRGTVEAESAGEGKGTTVRVRMPFRVATTTRAGRARARCGCGTPAGGELAPLGGLRVLVVDDAAGHVRRPRSVLREAGGEVRACRSAAEAARRARDLVAGRPPVGHRHARRERLRSSAGPASQEAQHGARSPRLR